jgi:carboxymethylenebutenolidase
MTKGLLFNPPVAFSAFVYAGVNHGFDNDSTGRYDKEAAELAWSHTLEFFGKHLS